MTGKLRLGKISIGIRTTASIEQRATPITITMTLIGRRSAARSSHILTALPAFYHAETAGTVEGHPAKRRPQPDSARRQAGPQHRRFLPAPGGSARPQHRRESRAPIDNVRAPDSPLCAPRPIPAAYFQQRCEPLREKLVPSAIAPSGLAGLDRNEPLRHVHLPIQSFFETGSRRCRIPERSPSRQPPSSNDPALTPRSRLPIYRQDPSHCRVRTKTIADRTSDSRNGPRRGPAPGLLPHVRAAPPQSDGW